MNRKAIKATTAGDFLGIRALLSAYQDGSLSPIYIMEQVLHRVAASADDAIWIYTVDPETVMLQTAELQRYMLENREWILHNPLLGIPFAVKDNIDVAGIPTTAGCPDFAYTPSVSATSVARLIEAGAILVGKTNIDQFATGLVGTRSPYGTPVNPFNPEYIPGGSSSGSAVAVARGLVSFALGTDTAGSGRVPAAFNNIVGLKPTRGLISNAGTVPACRSLDCISIFSLTVDDAGYVLDTLSTEKNRQRPTHRIQASTNETDDRPLRGLRFGIPQEQQLEFQGDQASANIYDKTLSRIRSHGADTIAVDLTPFLETARLLYDGPWIAERYAAIGKFIESHPDSILPVTKKIISTGKNITAVELFNGQYKLARLKEVVDRLFKEQRIDYLLLPTAPTCYSLHEIAEDPITPNSRLGHYTNFVNLLDLCALAIPAGIGPNGVPFGVSLTAPALSEGAMLAIGDQIHRSTGLYLGTSRICISDTDPYIPPLTALDTGKTLKLAVCGAHMSGLPLNHQLTDLGGRQLTTTTTAPDYKLFALDGFTPVRPGLLHVGSGQGSSIEVEVWELPSSQAGSFLKKIPSPLGLGTLTLAGGETVHGFICEQYATANATDVSSVGSWRKYINQNTA